MLFLYEESPMMAKKRKVEEEGDVQVSPLKQRKKRFRGAKPLGPLIDTFTKIKAPALALKLESIPKEDSEEEEGSEKSDPEESLAEGEEGSEGEDGEGGFDTVGKAEIGDEDDTGYKVFRDTDAEGEGDGFSTTEEPDATAGGEVADPQHLGGKPSGSISSGEGDAKKGPRSSQY